MGRKTDAETLKALEAKKTELEEKIKQKKAAIQEKIRTEEARKKEAEKRRVEHVKFLLGGFFLNFIAKEVVRLILENRDKVDLDNEDCFMKELKKAVKEIYRRYSLAFGNKKDKDVVEDGLARQIRKEVQVYFDAPEAYLAALVENPVAGESVSSLHDK